MTNLRMSQLLPAVKCSSCGQSVPLDKLGDHICTLVPPSSPSSSKHIPPRLKLHTAIVNASSAGATSPRLPSTSPRDVRDYDRGPPRSNPSNNPSRAPSRNGIRSPPLPPSRTQTPILPTSSVRQPISPYPGNGSRPQPEVAPNTNSHPNNIHAHPSVANHRRPSVPSTPLPQGHRIAHPVSMSNRPNPPIRVPPSPAPSNYSSHFMEPEIDTKSGGAAGMAGVGRRGFAAAARAAMFAASASSSVRLPTSPSPAPWSPASSSPPPLDGRRAYPPLDVPNPSAGTSSIILLLLILLSARLHCFLGDSWRPVVSLLSSFLICDL